jgi:BirA family biotin operon repressor/biotin-[acetyl-CoA-carboxylase] ligase
LAIRIFCNTAANVGGVVAADHFQPPPDWRPAPVEVAGWVVWRVVETGSTNADLIAAAAAGAPDRTVLVTGHQTAGRGRLDRRWDAPPGSNLLMSILLRVEPERAQALIRRLSVAAAQAIADITAEAPRLKWPNDLLLDGRKLAGVLAQAAPTGDAVVVGIGLNVGWAPEGAARLGDAIEPIALVPAVLTRFDQLDGETAMAAYRSLLDTVGRHVRVELDGEAVVGRAVGIDDAGHLLVLDECAITHRVDAGDVIHLRPG